MTGFNCVPGCHPPRIRRVIERAGGLKQSKSVTKGNAGIGQCVHFALKTSICFDL
jgi:hypothetical protein